MPPLPESNTREQQIYEQVVLAMVEQRLPPGMRLPEQRLSALYGVSRERMRRVLLRLSEAGYLELVPNVGARVWQPEPSEVAEIFQARRVIEAQLVRDACTHWKPADGQRLRENLAEEARALTRRDRSASIRLSGEFHLTLAGLGANRLLLGFLRELIARSSLALMLYAVPDAPTCPNHDHSELLGALERGDADQAAALMDEHLHELEDRLDIGAAIHRHPATLRLETALAADGVQTRPA
ncbi:GntR family transcriptional regulator (plasmid) [Deinococcus sp. KNUC1210]|uniref:GntR family transcriptional regulator n=1 Tax=Deinococcus sp. KNUC1210 TaxID=2917691 RepID=UPI001EF0CA46|nr:GntR family transcriptional regulator [Deinococcus sp. KNUC1210]ULH14239.1 GntR family transcriptional regulator [Deinococcus sp. KNUC1210]